MTAALALRLTAADFLKLRKRRGTVAWALVLALAPLVIFFAVRAAQHSSDALRYAPAGGTEGFIDAIRIAAVFFGPLAAILIGVEGGTGDVASGVFRDLVVTGRSRLALFASRVPAALALTWIVTAAAYGVLVLGTYLLASGSPLPSASKVIDGFGFALLSNGVVCAVAVGFAALTASRPAALTVLIGWHLVASPILAGISSLGSARELILGQAIVNFSPVHVTEHGGTVAMSQGTALGVLAAWLVACLSLGAWRTRTMDA
jgi:ABC-type transport system involved in multi-copper enzyme maturation permease subunit